MPIASANRAPQGCAVRPSPAHTHGDQHLQSPVCRMLRVFGDAAPEHRTCSGPQASGALALNCVCFASLVAVPGPVAVPKDDAPVTGPTGDRVRGEPDPPFSESPSTGRDFEPTAGTSNKNMTAPGQWLASSGVTRIPPMTTGTPTASGLTSCRRRAEGTATRRGS